MAILYTFRINARRTTLTSEEITEYGPLTNENTIVDAEVLANEGGNQANIASFSHVYHRQSTSKSQLANAIRAKATTAIDALLYGTGGEAGLVGPEFPV